MKTVFAALILCGSACGSACGFDQASSDAGVDPVGTINNVDDLAKESSYCGALGMKVCGTFCIPAKGTRCCTHPLPDGGFGRATWFHGGEDEICYH